jgi:formate-dependent nitrite reductase membrane component NrfD
MFSKMLTNQDLEQLVHLLITKLHAIVGVYVLRITVLQAAGQEAVHVRLVITTHKS